MWPSHVATGGSIGAPVGRPKGVSCASMRHSYRSLAKCPACNAPSGVTTIDTAPCSAVTRRGMPCSPENGSAQPRSLPIESRCMRRCPVDWIRACGDTRSAMRAAPGSGDPWCGSSSMCGLMPRASTQSAAAEHAAPSRSPVRSANALPPPHAGCTRLVVDAGVRCTVRASTRMHRLRAFLPGLPSVTLGATWSGHRI